MGARYSGTEDVNTVWSIEIKCDHGKIGIVDIDFEENIVKESRHWRDTTKRISGSASLGVGATGLFTVSASATWDNMYTEKVSNQEKFNSHIRKRASFVDDARHVYRVVTTKITVDGESKTKQEKFVLDAELVGEKSEWTRQDLDNASIKYMRDYYDVRNGKPIYRESTTVPYSRPWKSMIPVPKVRAYINAPSSQSGSWPSKKEHYERWVRKYGRSHNRLGLQEINIVLSKFQILADYPTEEKCAKILSEAEAKYNHFRDQSQRYRRKEKYKRGYKIWEAAVRDFKNLKSVAFKKYEDGEYSLEKAIQKSKL